MSELLRVTALGQSFNGKKILHDVSFSLDRGERLAVLGASGSGKTTLLRLIAGLEAPSEGQIVIDGKLMSRAGEVLIPPERREVALVFQGLALFPHLRALDQIAFAARGRGGRQRARILLEHIGLGHRADARLDELSGGERQRIALARALAQEPKLILMDEPFASLDDVKRAEMRDLLRSLLDNGNVAEKHQTTLVLVTHSHSDAFDLARRVLVLQHGNVAANDSLETVSARPQHVAAVQALGLGQILAGTIDSAGGVQTAFGNVGMPESPKSAPKSGSVLLLVRPCQPRIVADTQAAEGEVVSFELRPSEGREITRVAIVRVADKLLRVFARDQALAVGQHVRVRIDGACDLLTGTIS